MGRDGMGWDGNTAPGPQQSQGGHKANAQREPLPSTPGLLLLSRRGLRFRSGVGPARGGGTRCPSRPHPAPLPLHCRRTREESLLYTPHRPNGRGVCCNARLQQQRRQSAGKWQEKPWIYCRISALICAFQLVSGRPIPSSIREPHAPFSQIQLPPRQQSEHLKSSGN